MIFFNVKVYKFVKVSTFYVKTAFSREEAVKYENIYLVGLRHYYPLFLFRTLEYDE